jgi:hypothetical protein
MNEILIKNSIICMIEWLLFSTMEKINQNFTPKIYLYLIEKFILIAKKVLLWI